MFAIVWFPGKVGELPVWRPRVATPKSGCSRGYSCQALGLQWVQNHGVRLVQLGGFAGHRSHWLAQLWFPPQNLSKSTSRPLCKPFGNEAGGGGSGGGSAGGQEELGKEHHQWCFRERPGASEWAQDGFGRGQEDVVPAMGGEWHEWWILGVTLVGPRFTAALLPDVGGIGLPAGFVATTFRDSLRVGTPPVGRGRLPCLSVGRSSLLVGWTGSGRGGYSWTLQSETSTKISADTGVRRFSGFSWILRHCNGAHFWGSFSEHSSWWARQRPFWWWRLGGCECHCLGIRGCLANPGIFHPKSLHSEATPGVAVPPHRGVFAKGSSRLPGSLGRTRSHQIASPSSSTATSLATRLGEVATLEATWLWFDPLHGRRHLGVGQLGGSLPRSHRDGSELLSGCRPDAIHDGLERWSDAPETVSAHFHGAAAVLGRPSQLARHLTMDRSTLVECTGDPGCLEWDGRLWILWRSRSSQWVAGHELWFPWGTDVGWILPETTLACFLWRSSGGPQSSVSGWILHLAAGLQFLCHCWMFTTAGIGRTCLGPRGFGVHRQGPNGSHCHGRHGPGSSGAPLAGGPSEAMATVPPCHALALGRAVVASLQRGMCNGTSQGTLQGAMFRLKAPEKLQCHSMAQLFHDTLFILNSCEFKIVQTCARPVM